MPPAPLPLVPYLHLSVQVSVKVCCKKPDLSLEKGSTLLVSLGQIGLKETKSKKYKYLRLNNITLDHLSIIFGCIEKMMLECFTKWDPVLFFLF